VTTKALGLIETIGLITAIEAADTALKAANVKLLGYENTKGGGRITIKLVGDVGAVKAAVAAGVAAAERIGRIESFLVIPRPHQEIEGLVSYVDRGPAKVAVTAVAAEAELAGIPLEEPAKAKTAVVMPEAPAVPKTKAPAPAKSKSDKPKAASGKAKPARRAPKPKAPVPPAQVEIATPAEPPVSPAPIEEVIPAVEPESLVPSAVEPEPPLPGASEPEPALPGASEPGSEQPLSS
jgi:ethanolamine utilization protein EutM